MPAPYPANNPVYTGSLFPNTVDEISGEKEIADAIMATQAKLLGLGPAGVATTMNGPLLFSPDQTYNIGAPGARVNNLFIGGNIAGANQVSAFELDYVILKSTATGGGTIFNGSGAPAGASGANGDYYFRTDTPGTALQRIYVKSAGVWVGIV